MFSYQDHKLRFRWKDGLANIPFFLSSACAGFLFFTAIIHFKPFILYLILSFLFFLLWKQDCGMVKRHFSSNTLLCALVIACFMASCFYTAAIKSVKVQTVVAIGQRFLPLSSQVLTFAGSAVLGAAAVYFLLFLICGAIEKLGLLEEMRQLKAHLLGCPHIGRWYLALLCVNLLGISSLLRANIDFHDDMQRMVDGIPGFELFSRHLTGTLSKLVNTGTYLTDLSPLTQILAMILISAASIILILVFTRKDKITVWNLIAVVPVGLSPYFLECLSYKIDSPYMGLTVFAGVFPLLFWRSKPAFYITITALSTLVISCIYQAGLGIYPAAIVLLAFVLWVREQDLGAVVRLILTSVAGYVLGMAVYYLFIMKPVDSYVSSSIFPLSQLPGGVMGNLQGYFSLVLADFDIKWLAAIGLILISFVLLSVGSVRRHKVVTAVAAIAAIAVALSLSFSLYIALTTPSFSCRAMYGFTTAIAILALVCTDFDKAQIGKLSALYLSWCFVVFSFLYGNALEEQVRYRDFRMEMVLQQLDDAEILDRNGPTEIQISGSIGISPLVKNMPQYNTALRRLVTMTFQQDASTWNHYAFFHYYGLEDVTPVTGLEEEMEAGALPLLHDGYYEAIYGDEDSILIVLK